MGQQVSYNLVSDYQSEIIHFRQSNGYRVMDFNLLTNELYVHDANEILTIIPRWYIQTQKYYYLKFKNDRFLVKIRLTRPRSKSHDDRIQKMRALIKSLKNKKKSPRSFECRLKVYQRRKRMQTSRLKAKKILWISIPK